MEIVWVAPSAFLSWGTLCSNKLNLSQRETVWSESVDLLGLVRTNTSDERLQSWPSFSQTDCREWIFNWYILALSLILD